MTHELPWHALAVGYGTLACIQSSRVVSSWQWMRGRHALAFDTTQDLTVVLLIPVLREQAVIERTLRHLASLDYPKERLRVVAVTTAKEEAEREAALGQLAEAALELRAGVTPEEVARRRPGLGPAALVARVLRETVPAEDRLRDAITSRVPTTAEVVDSIIEGQQGEPVVRRIHYPFTHGAMAHQINWGVRYLFEVVDHGVDPRRTWVGVYNADSRPHVDTLRHLTGATSQLGEAALSFQQHSVYRLPAEGSRSHALHAAAAWQTRWSMAVEQPRARRAAALLGDGHFPPVGAWRRLRLALTLPYSYAIGHGLFVRLDEFVRANYLPEHTANEDAPFGYLQLLRGRPLRPLPVMDDAEVPRTVDTLVTQQGGWFRGPLDAIRYLRIARERRLDAHTGGLLPVALCARVAWDAVAWLGGPVLALAVLSACVVGPSQGKLLALVGALAHLLLPTGVALALAPKSTAIGPQPLRALLGMPSFYLIHGLGPARYLAQLGLSSLRRRPLPKYKTER